MTLKEFFRRWLMNKDNFSYLVTNFFSMYLNHELGVSQNTSKSYRDAFVLYIKFLDEKNICKPSKFNAEFFNVKYITFFLEWVENERHSSISTRNQRLAALKSFSNYAIRERPEYFYNYQGILKIHSKKAPKKAVEYLSVDSIACLLNQPDLSTTYGMRDLAMLSLMYESGCRIQELLDLSVGDLYLGTPATVKLCGKGNKSRIVPLSKQVAKIIGQHINSKPELDQMSFLFSNKQGNPLTRAGFAYILNKHVTTAKLASPELYPKHVHPHMLRHSKAMHLLENGVNLIYIRDILGHESVTTTEIYARCNPEIKRKYILEASTIIDGVVEDYSDVKKESLLSWLKETL